MTEQSSARKLTKKDLFDGSQHDNNHGKGFSYNIENNQKKYSYRQKVKP